MAFDIDLSSSRLKRYFNRGPSLEFDIDFDDRTAKMFGTFTLANLLVLALGYKIIPRLGLLRGFAVVAAIAFTLPMVIQYFLLRDEVGQSS